MRIGYLGPKGTFTHFACQQAIQDHELTHSEMIQYQSLDRLFDALTNESVDYVFSPIENSIEGPVNRVLDALTHIENTYIHSSYTMPINQSILSFNNAILATNIQHIVSMPHAIAQCYAFIQSNCPNATLHHAPSTAGSVPMIDALKLPRDTTVVIGHQGIADYFPIHIIEKNIQDQKMNSTEFCLIGRAEPDVKSIHDMTQSLLAFSTPKDSPGSLLSVLEIFKDHQINLSKILSRPEKSDMGSYIFFVEFPTKFDNISLNELFSKIKKKSQFFKHLGTYKNRGFHD